MSRHPDNHPAGWYPPLPEVEARPATVGLLFQTLIMATTTIAQRPRLKLAWGPILWMGCLHLAALLAFVPAWFTWSGLALCFLLHWVSGGIGICMTYHRLLTHRSFA